MHEIQTLRTMQHVSGKVLIMTLKESTEHNQRCLMTYYGTYNGNMEQTLVQIIT